MDISVVKIETFIPKEYVDKLREALNEIAALSIGGNYDNCMAISKVTGYWRSLKGANPFEGEVGELSCEEECKVEFCCLIEVAKQAVETIKKVHPYEVPVINVIQLINF